MSDLPTTSQWIQFFRNASLPLNVAANYAIIFSDNRIHLNMLMDLTKEYLFDMGIKAMGDVIAILRYAKEYHNQLVKEKMIGDKSSPGKRESPTTRMLTHYTRPAAVSSKSLTKSVVFLDQLPAASVKRSLISLSSQNAGNPAKKLRAMISEEEGTYNVKMPVGSTERSRRLLQKQQQQQMAMKRSVFDRLGDSVVSSSTDVKHNKGSSVFNRLGPATSLSNEVSTSTSISEWTSDASDIHPLPYQGILKGLSSGTRNASNVVKTSTVVKTSPTRKITVTKNLGTTRTIGQTAAQSRRTVLPRARDLAASTVVQVNKILAQNSNTNRMNTVVSTKFSRQGVVGNRLTTVRLPITKRLGSKTNTVKTINVAGRGKIAVGRGKVISLKSPGHKFAQVSRESVFQRLGQ